MEKKHVILLTVIAIATLLITVVGATFAFYSMTPTGADDAEDVTIQSASGLTLTYDDGETFTASNIIPGWGETILTPSNTKTVTVKNDSAAELIYDLEWKSISNSITDAANFKYSLKVTATGGSLTNTNVADKNFEFKKVPEAAEKIATEVHINPGETETYVLTFKYENLNQGQGNPNGTDKFEGVLDVPEKNIKAQTAKTE